MAKDRTQPCIYYAFHGADCKKGFKKVDIRRCKVCPKYQPRKTNHKPENIKIRRQKDKDRIDKRQED